MIRFLLLIVAFGPVGVFGQSYTSYFTGNPLDTLTAPLGGICLMGGASEDDNAMSWFLQQAAGGDVLVLRASGSDGYNNYLYSSLGVAVNSVETIVCHGPQASYEPYIHEKIRQAEAIWFAGGDQWDYVSYWRNTPVDSLINEGIAQRNIVVGGTSAGMAIQGKYYFSAKNGSVTSAEALANPYHFRVTVDSAAFLNNSILHDVITDTHYDNPDRKGRHVVFLARILADYGVAAKGIACDEYTAVCIDTGGIARVFGEYPPHNDNAYFIQANCALSDFSPEACATGDPLVWDRGNQALKVYAVKGTESGANTFDLNDWATGSGGSWQDWYVVDGVLYGKTGDPIDCSVSSQKYLPLPELKVFPNPAHDYIKISAAGFPSEKGKLEVFDSVGQEVRAEEMEMGAEEIILYVGGFGRGLYLARLSAMDNSAVYHCWFVIF